MNLIKSIWVLLSNGKARALIADILDELEQYLDGVTTAETALKNIAELVLDFILPGEDRPEIEVTLREE